MLGFVFSGTPENEYRRGIWQVSPHLKGRVPPGLAAGSVIYATTTAYCGEYRGTGPAMPGSGVWRRRGAGPAAVLLGARQRPNYLANNY